MSDTALAPIEAEIVPAEQPSALMRRATDVAGVCREIVLRTACNIQGRKYVKCEGWMSIATAHGCIASSRNVERVEGGWTAIGEIRRMSDGVLLSQAEGYVGKDEKRWSTADEYACRAMAQTRAISRACRAAFAHVVVLIDGGLSTTPAEEIPDGGFDRAKPAKPKPAEQAIMSLANAPKLWKSSAERQKWLDGFLSKCRTELGLKPAFTEAPDLAVEYFQKSGLLLPTEATLSATSFAQLFPSVPTSQGDNESDGDFKVQVQRGVAADAKRVLDGFEAFKRGDQLEGAEAIGDDAPLPSGAKEMSGFIKLVNKKPTSKGGTKYGILIVQDLQDREGGEWVNSFDDKDGKLAESLKGQEVAVAYIDGQYGKDLCKHAIREVN